MTNDRLQYHLTQPICRTMHGCWEHLRALSLKELWSLMHALDCHSVEDIEVEFWKRCKEKRNVSKKKEEKEDM